MQININDILRAQAQQRRVCKNITPEVNISPPMGTPEYDEWLAKLEKDEKDKKDKKDEKMLQS